MCGGYHCRLGEYFQQKLAIEARLFSEGDSLSDRLHAHAEQSVDHQLHRGPGTARAQMEILLRQGGKDWLAGFEHIRVTAAEERQSALFSGGPATGKSHIHDLDSPPPSHALLPCRRTSASAS